MRRRGAPVSHFLNAASLGAREVAQALKKGFFGMAVVMVWR